MRDFGYSTRARAVNEAQAEIHDAFKEVVNRNDESDPRTQRWLNAIRAFNATYSRVYPEDLRLFEQGALPGSEIGTADILDFVEADPVFFRSGYMKEALLGALKQRPLTQHEITRLQTVILNVVQKADRREFRRFCRAAAVVDDQNFREELKGLEVAEDPGVRRRSRWVLEALDKATSQT